MSNLDFTWVITAKQDDLPVRGNAIQSNDKEYDKKIEDEILHRLDCGEVWAWAAVQVECSIIIDGETFVGYDYLGACSYKNEDDFKVGGYYENMMNEAKKDLFEILCDAVKRGDKAKIGLDGYNV